LGSSSLGAGLPIRSKRRQRRRGRTAADRVVYACLDQRDPFIRRFRAWPRCIWPFNVLEMPPLAGGHIDRHWGRSDSAYLRQTGHGKDFEESAFNVSAGFVQEFSLGTETDA
jgi:hypothetical protein